MVICWFVCWIFRLWLHIARGSASPSVHYNLTWSRWMLLRTWNFSVAPLWLWFGRMAASQTKPWSVGRWGERNMWNVFWLFCCTRFSAARILLSFAESSAIPSLSYSSATVQSPFSATMQISFCLAVTYVEISSSMSHACNNEDEEPFEIKPWISLISSKTTVELNSYCFRNFQSRLEGFLR